MGTGGGVYAPQSAPDLLVSELSYSAVRSRLKKAGLSLTDSCLEGCQGAVGAAGQSENL